MERVCPVMKIVVALFLIFGANIIIADEIEIYVISHSEHSGIAIPNQYINLDYLENSKDFKNAKYIEIGFGDKDYYMDPNPSALEGIEAVFWPTESVMHVVGIRGHDLKKIFPECKIYRLKATKENIKRLNKYIFESFKYQDRKNVPIGKSQYLTGNFYDGSHDFYLFNTCNTWVAKALKYSGYDVDPALVIRQESLTDSISKVAEEI